LRRRWGRNAHQPDKCQCGGDSISHHDALVSLISDMSILRRLVRPESEALIMRRRPQT
jgi:hypothetical protein